MPVFKIIRFSNQIKCLLRIQSPLYKPFPPSPHFIIRTLHTSPQKPIKKPLSLFFQEAVGLIEIAGGAQSQSKGEKNELISGKKRETEGVERGKPKKDKNLVELFGGEKEEEKVDEMVIMGLGKEVRNLKEKPTWKRKGKERVERGKPKKVESSVEVFGGGKKEEKVQKMGIVRRGRKDVRVLKGLSQLTETFIRHLYAKGYFKKASFLEVDKPKLVYFDNSYSRTFIKFAAYEFGKDHQEIARWLSGSHLKKVVLFGCPSLDRYDIFAAKRLRRFFKIQENTVCSECILKDSCKYANKSVWGIGTKSLLLTDVMQVIALYAVELVHPMLTVPDEVKDSVNQLLEQIIKLSQPT